MEINDKYKFLGFLGDRINDNNEKIQELLKDENVRKYIYLVDENRRLSLAVKDEMESCSHVFAKTDIVEDGVPVYHCLKCGLTNEYAVKMPKKVLTEFENQITDIFKRTFGHGMIISDEICKLNIAREVYNFIKRENLSISHADLEKAFSHVYPKFVEMKNKGTLGKCNTNKSAAELWYEMEERCHAGAIATLNKILEDKQGKIK